MNNTYELHIKYQPISSGRTPTSISRIDRAQQYVDLHKGLSLDEAIVFLFGIPPNHYSSQSAIKLRLGYFISDINIYNEASKQLVATMTTDYGLSTSSPYPNTETRRLVGNFKEISSELRNMLQMSHDKQSNELIDFVKTDPEKYKSAFILNVPSSDMGSLYAWHFKKKNSFCYVRPIYSESYPPDGAWMHVIHRTSSITAALRTLLSDRVTSTGEYYDHGYPTHDPNSFITKADVNKNILTAMTIDRKYHDWILKPGIYLYTNDQTALADALRKEPTLKQLFSSEQSPIPITVSQTNSYLHSKATKEVIQFINNTEIEQLKTRKQTNIVRATKKRGSNKKL